MDPVALIKYTILLVGTPFWLPFVKELLKEFKLAMREDGGFWGTALSRKQQRALANQIAREPLRQVHIPKGHLGIRRKAPSVDKPNMAGPQAGAKRSRGFGS